jgi:hypothetical protein
LTADGVTFNSEYCNYSVYQDTVLVNTACSISIASLMQAPFSHQWGATISAKVLAMNAYGNSLYSDLGNGAVIMTYADTPTNLIENYSQRAPTSLGLVWTAPATDGGASIFDYTVSYDQGLDTYIVLE